MLELREPPPDGTFGVGDLSPLAPQLRPAFKGMLIVNSDYDVARAQAMLDEVTADAIAFGRLFIANPDLPLRLARKLPLARDDVVHARFGGLRSAGVRTAAGGDR
jgi:2,4-dienoyl-CoA reductase-like NADH-dependent reductase (Old Yellow Enzyme family)